MSAGGLTWTALTARLQAAPPLLGAVRLVCVDGPAGAGKSTLAARLADELGPGTAVLHMDDLYAGWTLTGSAARLAAGVLRPLASGAPGAFHRYDWHAGRFAEASTPVPVPGVLLVEGCGSCSRTTAPWASLRLWVEAPEALRHARWVARDGAAMLRFWDRWAAAEAAFFAAEGTRDLADLRIDGSTPGAELVLLR